MTITMSGIQFLMSVKVIYKCQKVTRLINFSVIMSWKKVISEHIHYDDITSNEVMQLLLLKYNISFEVFLTVT